MSNELPKDAWEPANEGTFGIKATQVHTFTHLGPLTDKQRNSWRSSEEKTEFPVFYDTGWKDSDIREQGGAFRVADPFTLGHRLTHTNIVELEKMFNDQSKLRRDIECDELKCDLKILVELDGSQSSRSYAKCTLAWEATEDNQTWYLQAIEENGTITKGFSIHFYNRKTSLVTDYTPQRWANIKARLEAVDSIYRALNQLCTDGYKALTIKTKEERKVNTWADKTETIEVTSANQKEVERWLDTPHSVKTILDAIMNITGIGDNAHVFTHYSTDATAPLCMKADPPYKVTDMSWEGVDCPSCRLIGEGFTKQAT